MCLSHNTFGSGAKCVVSLVMFSWANVMTLPLSSTFRFHFGVCFRKPERNQIKTQCPTKTPQLTTTRTVGLLKNLTIQQFVHMNSISFAGTNRRLRELVWSTAEGAGFEFRSNTSHTRCLRFPSYSTCYAPLHATKFTVRKQGSCTNFPGSISQFPKEPMSSTRSTAALNQTAFSSKFRHFLYRRHSEHSRTGLNFALSPTMAWTVLRLRLKETTSRHGRQLLTYRIRRGWQLTWSGPPARRLDKGPTTPRHRKPACYRTFHRTPDCTIFWNDLRNR